MLIELETIETLQEIESELSFTGRQKEIYELVTKMIILSSTICMVRLTENDERDQMQLFEYRELRKDFIQLTREE
jgi:hypothetical protein